MRQEGPQVERRMRQLMADADIPEPDEVQHSVEQVKFLWYDRKVAVVVELDSFTAGEEQ